MTALWKCKPGRSRLCAASFLSVTLVISALVASTLACNLMPAMPTATTVPTETATATVTKEPLGERDRASSLSMGTLSPTPEAVGTAPPAAPTAQPTTPPSSPEPSWRQPPPPRLASCPPRRSRRSSRSHPVRRRLRRHQASPPAPPSAPLSHSRCRSRRCAATGLQGQCSGVTSRWPGCACS